MTARLNLHDTLMHHASYANAVSIYVGCGNERTPRFLEIPSCPDLVPSRRVARRRVRGLTTVISTFQLSQRWISATGKHYHSGTRREVPQPEEAAVRRSTNQVRASISSMLIGLVTLQYFLNNNSLASVTSSSASQLDVGYVGQCDSRQVYRSLARFTRAIVREHYDRSRNISVASCIRRKCVRNKLCGWKGRLATIFIPAKRTIYSLHIFL